jgi:hypothetical protein
MRHDEGSLIEILEIPIIWQQGYGYDTEYR